MDNWLCRIEDLRKRLSSLIVDEDDRRFYSAMLDILAEQERLIRHISDYLEGFKVDKLAPAPPKETPEERKLRRDELFWGGFPRRQPDVCSECPECHKLFNWHYDGTDFPKVCPDCRKPAPEPTEFKTPDEWQKILMADREICDPDGWRNDGKSWDEPITKEEFNRRAAFSTQVPKPDPVSITRQEAENIAKAAKDLGQAYREIHADDRKGVIDE